MLTLLAYCVLVYAASWLGGMLASLLRLTHTRLQLLISLIGGLMLGVGLLHQLPHAVAALEAAHTSAPLDLSVKWMVVGLTAMFVLLRMFHFHQHDPFDEPVPPGVAHQHDHDCGHDHDHGHVRGPASHSWMGLAFGLSVHTLSDGLALAAHVEADRVLEPGGWLPGLGTFLGVVLHKPLDSLSLTSIMSASGASRPLQRIVNAGYALLCPIGALLFVLGMQSLSEGQHLVVGCALALSAGLFVCISLSDLLPEVQFHSHDKLRLTAALLTGLLLAWGIGFLEPEHSHGGGAASHGHLHPHGHKH